MLLDTTTISQFIHRSSLFFGLENIPMENIVSSFLTGITAFVLFSVYLAVTKKKSEKKNSKNNLRMVPKVSGGLPILGHAISFASDTEAFLQKCKEKYGRAFELNVMGKKMVFLDGTYKQDFFALPEKVISFTEMNMQTLAPELTFGVETITNPYHIPVIRRQFTGKNLEKYLHRLDNQVNNVIKNHVDDQMTATTVLGNNDDSSKKVAIIENCELLAWKIIASCSASSFLGEEISKNEKVINVFIEYHKACYQVMNYSNILPKALLQFCAKNVKEQETVIREVVVPEVNRRRQMIKNKADGTGDEDASLPEDFLSSLAELQRKTPEDIAKRMMAFIFASMVTSAGALTHAILDLAGRQKEWTVLLDEQKRAMKKHGNAITQQAMDDMPYLHAFIWESMRMASLPIQQARMAVGKDGVVLRSQTKNNENESNIEEDSIFIPKGTSIMMSGYLASTDETSVERANEFWPGRFLERQEKDQNAGDIASVEKEDENKDSGDDNEKDFVEVRLVSDTASKGFFPFGIGRHYCPGRKFALAEIKGSLCVLLRSYRLQTVSGEIPKYNRVPSDTLRINEPVEFSISSI